MKYDFYPGSHYVVDPATNCWIWVRAMRDECYGSVTIDKKQYRAHRAMWIVRNGPIPDNLKVLHKCDNTKCINPDHLFLGTQQDNIRDCMNKGRLNTDGFWWRDR